jgi:hypothetical protein
VAQRIWNRDLRDGGAYPRGIVEEKFKHPYHIKLHPKVHFGGICPSLVDWNNLPRGPINSG